MHKNPNVGPDPVETEANHVREKTFVEPEMPKAYEKGLARLPENTAEEKVRDGMSDAVDTVKKKI